MKGGVVSQKGREDDKLGMEVKGLKNKVAQVVARKKASMSGGMPAGAGACCDTCKGGAPAGAGQESTLARMKRMIDVSGPKGAGKKKSTARGQAIAKLMKEKGMTLGQASKYLKENA
jgi:hypothetical protein